MAKITHVLPPMAQNTHLQQLDAGGRWEPIADNSLLLNIARGLRVVSKHESERYLVSIPDVWARTELVKSALFEKEHRLHYEVTREWRGLLALIALSPYHGYQLTTELVQLGELERNPFDAGNQEESVAEGSNLGAVVNDLIPSAVLSNEQNWREIALLRCDGEPVGLIVPSVLVCPGRNIGKVLNRVVPWCDQGRLSDPCQVTNVQSDEFASLKKLLETILIKVKEDGTNIDVASGITGALTNYLDACTDRFEELSADGENILNRLTAEPTNFALPQQPIYPVLNNVFIIDWGTEEHFDTLVRTREEFSGLLRGAVIADEQMASTADRHPARIKIWRNYSLQTYLDSPNSRSKMEAELTDFRYMLLEPSDLFTNTLCRITDELYFTTHGDNRNSFLLPFDPKILLFLTPEELDARTKITKTGRGYRASLRLSLVRSDGTSWEHTLEKDYGEEEVVTKEVPNSISQWPDFQHADWPWYFFFFTGNLAIHFAPRSLFSAEEVRSYLQEAPDQITRLKLLKEFGSRFVQAGERLGLLETQVLSEIYMLTSAPEAVICDAAVGGDVSAFVDSSRRQLQGILILPQIQRVQTSARSATVGIDFGTTNTSAYMRIGAEKGVPMTFGDRIVSPIVAAGSSPELVNILREFYPHREISIPFLTILRDRLLSEEVVEVYPSWNSHIYYVGDVVDAIKDLTRDETHRLRFNLKWSKVPSDRLLVRQYMAQVVLQCLSEMFARGIRPRNVDWKFSHPEAFPPSQLEDFISICSSATKMALAPDPDDQNFVPSIERQSESLSTALYFISEQRAHMVQNAVTIDIGGHTSDISVWQARRLVWRNSLEFAGRHIFINYLRENTALLDALADRNKVLQEGLSELEELIAEDPERFGYGIEILVNSESFAKAFERDFELIGGVKEGGLLKQISLIALSGILYYTGLTIRHLVETGAMEVLPHKHMTVCLGGRGSLIYNAIFKDGVVGDRERDGVLNLFCEVAGDAIESASFIFSGHHKHEVAYGLLVDASGDTDLDLESARSEDMLIGEDFKIDGKEVSQGSLIKDLPRSGEWRLDDVSSIRSLIELMVRYLRVRIDLEEDQAAKNDLIGSINSQLVGAQDRLNQEAEIVEKLAEYEIVGETEVVEPVYVVVLRSLLEQIVNNRIRVDFLND